ncbi:DUF1345 domain-containing protein [Isoptericola sp. NEAU-Y5]|uniref:DUF1345 domain-containing protein n=1 Tax=Isoptericola luteus TaxID=2879484 RepID=A0ABS7ZKL1_9MICO|nr:DUF1345 domain-containing protein [Isoptericola sp. NEAU-Y5]MCA5894174.1 DUF1345 domain-containing protein [Isoptericola sp. NEAU-Y5]
MAHPRSRSDFFRAWVSSLVAAVVAVGGVTFVGSATSVPIATTADTVITTFVFLFPVYAVVYVGWGARTYSRLEPARLREVASAELRDQSRRLHRALGLTGTANTTISAAVIAVVATVGIAQSPQFRGETIYLVAGLLTVASAWILMVFSYAQAYLRLDAQAGSSAPVRFPSPTNLASTTTSRSPSSCRPWPRPSPRRSPPGRVGAWCVPTSSWRSPSTP